jgi:hypothetical protein
MQPADNFMDLHVYQLMLSIFCPVEGTYPKNRELESGTQYCVKHATI